MPVLAVPVAFMRHESSGARSLTLPVDRLPETEVRVPAAAGAAVPILSTVVLVQRCIAPRVAVTLKRHPLGLLHVDILRVRVVFVTAKLPRSR